MNGVEVQNSLVLQRSATHARAIVWPAPLCEILGCAIDWQVRLLAPAWEAVGSRQCYRQDMTAHL